MRARRPLQSLLARDIALFVAHKRALGRRYDVEEKTLALFDRYLIAHHINSLRGITPKLIDEFLLSRHRTRPRSYNHLRCTLGRLFSYMVSRNRITRTPVQSPPRRGTYERRPFIFDIENAKRLLSIAQRLPDKGGTIERGRVYYMLFALLFGLGLRVGEVCRLRIEDVDADQGLLIILPEPSSARYWLSICNGDKRAIPAAPPRQSPCFACEGAGPSTPAPSVRPFITWCHICTSRFLQAFRPHACMIFDMRALTEHSCVGIDRA
jgi:integrase